MAPPPGKGCPIKSLISAPARAHFTEKVPQLGHILRRKCPSWGIFYGESVLAGAHFTERVSQLGRILRKSAQGGANFAEKVSHIAKFIRAFCPTFSVGPAPFTILYLPLNIGANPDNG